jgi:DNA-binding NarL/FixJ family response regulator
VIRVVLVDDQQLIRAGLRALLDLEEDIDVVGEAADGDAAIELVRQTRPDVAVMDIRMPGVDGLEATRRIVAEPDLAGTRILILTTFEVDEYVFESLRVGASGFIAKDAEPTELLRAVRVVADGGSLLSPLATQSLISEFVGSPAQRRIDRSALDQLTEREREVVALVAGGLSNEEIAAELFISTATARTHVGRSMAKLHARDRAQLVVLAYESGLVDVRRST